MRYAKFLAVSIVVLAACSGAAQTPRQPAPADVVGMVGNASITLAEVDEKALQQPASNYGSAKLSQALYEARRAAIDDIVANRLMDAEAKAQHLDRSALIEKEITAKISPVTEAVIAEWYRANQARVQGAPLDQVRSAIRSYLTEDQMRTIRQDFLNTLKARTSIRVMLDPPRQAVATGNSPSRGPSNAPIEIVEFSDFQCPFCSRGAATSDARTTAGCDA
jgi:hypothetical protein